MPSNTPNVNLYKKDVSTDGNDTFNITTMLNDNWDKIDEKFGQQDKDFIRQPAFLSATSTNNVYTATSTPNPTAYIDGMGIVLKADKDSTGSVTLNWNGLGAKALKDANGNDVKLRANSIYTFRYNSDTGNFISQAKGGAGNATADTILSGYTASTDNGDVIGNIPIKTSQQNTQASNKTTGNYDGVGQAAYLMPPKGYYDGTAWIYSKENDLISDNIKAGKTIFGIQGKGSVVETNDAVATSADIVAPKTAYVNGQKIVGNIISRPDGQPATNSVVWDNNGTKQMAVRIPNGAYLANHDGLGNQEVQLVENNLRAENIKAGTSIFGVAGKASVVDTADATATASQIRSNQTAYVNGSKVVGALPVQATSAQTIIPGTSDIVKSAGIYDGSITVKGDSNLASTNIKAGSSIFGVSGKSSVVDTADATALTADKILNGYSAYANGSKINGSAISQKYYSKTLNSDVGTKTFSVYVPLGGQQNTSQTLHFLKISKTEIAFAPNYFIANRIDGDVTTKRYSTFLSTGNLKHYVYFSSNGSYDEYNGLLMDDLNSYPAKWNNNNYDDSYYYIPVVTNGTYLLESYG